MSGGLTLLAPVLSASFRIALCVGQRPAPIVAGPVSGPAELRLRSVSLDTPSTSTVQLFWILSLDGEPPTFIRVEMFDHTRMLAVVDSPVIRNGKAPLPGA